MIWKQKFGKIFLFLLALAGIVNILCITNYLPEVMAKISFIIIVLSSTIINISNMKNKDKHEHEVYKGSPYSIIFAVFSLLLWGISYMIIVFD